MQVNMISKIPFAILIVSLVNTRLSFGESEIDTNVEVLDLSNGGLISVPDYSSFKNLKKVNLANNSLTNLDVKTFAYNDALSEIDLSGNGFVEFPVLESWTLTKLNLSNNHLRQIPTGAFVRLPKLQVLDLSGNQLKSLKPIAQIAQNSLKHLIVSRIKDHDLKRICKNSKIVVEIVDDDKSDGCKDFRKMKGTKSTYLKELIMSPNEYEIMKDGLMLANTHMDAVMMGDEPLLNGSETEIPYGLTDSTTSVQDNNLNDESGDAKDDPQNTEDSTKDEKEDSKSPDDKTEVKGDLQDEGNSAQKQDEPQASETNEETPKAIENSEETKAAEKSEETKASEKSEETKATENSEEIEEVKSIAEETVEIHLTESKSTSAVEIAAVDADNSEKSKETSEETPQVEPVEPVVANKEDTDLETVESDQNPVIPSLTHAPTSENSSVEASIPENLPAAKITSEELGSKVTSEDSTAKKSEESEEDDGTPKESPKTADVPIEEVPLTKASEVLLENSKSLHDGHTGHDEKTHQMQRSGKLQRTGDMQEETAIRDDEGVSLGASHSEQASVSRNVVVSLIIAIVACGTVFAGYKYYMNKQAAKRDIEEDPEAGQELKELNKGDNENNDDDPDRINYNNFTPNDLSAKEALMSRGRHLPDIDDEKRKSTVLHV